MDDFFADFRRIGCPAEDTPHGLEFFDEIIKEQVASFTDIRDGVVVRWRYTLGLVSKRWKSCQG